MRWQMAERRMASELGGEIGEAYLQVSNNDHVLLPEVTALQQFKRHNVISLPVHVSF